MLEALRALRLEVDAIISVVGSLPRGVVSDPQLRQRVEELFLSWSGLRGKLLSVRAEQRVVEACNTPLEQLLRLTTTERPRRDTYLRLLGLVRQGLGQALLEVARLGIAATPGKAMAATSSFLPEVPGLSNELIPRSLYGWTDNMREFLRQHNYDRNVFVMVAYRARLQPLITRIERRLSALGLNAVLARDCRITDDLYKPLACLLCCQYGVAIFDRGETGQTHNANIVYELAVMQTLKRPCVILKHKSLRTMPSDFLHRLYEPYRTVADAVRQIDEWWNRIAAGAD